MFKKRLFFICMVFWWSWGQIAVAQSLSIDVHNKPSLQRGAKLFMNYCSGCHSLKYLRYNRMAEDIGLSGFDGQVDKNLLKII